ncbi:MAG TPA: glutathione S-transferase family protein [Caulobacteraceae bacterium]|jgi:glutathione S-transferase|nr:glutathione S-transferase family protein [Caulobacteraceae bacterium]
MYTLYYSPGAASLVVHQALMELGVRFELKLIDIETGQQKTPAYLAINPAGVVPTLIVDNQAVGEAAAILILLSERFPHAGLAPAAGTPDRAVFLQWMFFLANTLQPQYRRWFYPGDDAAPEREAEIKDNARRRIEAAWTRIDNHLAGGGFMAGDYSALDMHATMLGRWSRNMPKPADRWPHVAAWLAKTTARPAWSAVHKAEGLEVWPPKT